MTSSDVAFVTIYKYIRFAILYSKNNINTVNVYIWNYRGSHSSSKNIHIARTILAVEILTVLDLV